MDANQFLAEFGRVVNAPGGVQSLREMIGNLAMQGMLLPQDPNETPASELLNKIELKKQRVNIKRKFLYLQSIKPEEMTYALPEGWAWVRLGSVVEVLDSQRKPITKKHRKLGPYPYYGASGVVDYVSDFLFDEPLVLLGEDGAKWGRGENTAFLISGKTWVNNHAHVLRSIKSVIIDKFLAYSLISMDLQPYITGMTVPKLNQRRLVSIVVPLPPLPEQKRIVAKVDELMALCDKLETQQQKRRNLHALTRTAALDALANAQTNQGIKTAWQLLQGNCHLLINNPDDVSLLQYTIQHIGCKGLLSEEVINLDFQDDKYPFSVPTNWSWTTLGELSEYITSGSRGWKKYVSKQGDIFIRSQDIKTDQLMTKNSIFVTLPEKIEGKRTLVVENDLLITITGANVGKCALVPILNKKAYVSQHVALIRLKDPRNAPYLHLWLTNSFGGRRHLLAESYGDKPGLNLKQVSGVIVPLPPLSSQKKIVRLINQKVSLCKKLENQTIKLQFTSDKFAQAATAAITGTQIKENQPMKAPKTELVTKLKLEKSPKNKDQAPLSAILARHNGELSAKTLYNYSGIEIDGFYQQLKTEMAQGWIVEPEKARVVEKAAAPDNQEAL
jgi:type I restriction enzyme, S subunit